MFHSLQSEVIYGVSEVIIAVSKHTVNAILGANPATVCWMYTLLGFEVSQMIVSFCITVIMMQVRATSNVNTSKFQHN